MKRSLSILMVPILISALALSIASPANAASLAGTWADFNGDGYSDLAVASPFTSGGGTVTVIPGSATGLDPAAAVRWSRASAGAGSGSTTDNFGAALAAGDFHGDGFSDLAIGAPGATVMVNSVAKSQAGVVVVLRGSASGLTATGSQLWSQQTPGIHGVASRFDAFGEALASGDINGDGAADLVVGSPGNSHRASNGTLHRFSGQVNVLYGSPAGLTATDSRRYLQATPGVAGATSSFDRFGSALALGDANDDGHDELAIGTPADGSWDAGSVNILLGSTDGLTTTGGFLLTQNTEGVPGVSEQADLFGYALAFGDHNDDGRADLDVGVPGEYYSSRIYSSGQVQVFRGSAGGLSVSGVQTIDQETDGISGSPEPLDQFGRSLAAGDYNADGVHDLMVGAPEESIGDVWGAGAAFMLPGGAGLGVTGSGSAILMQGRAGIEDTASQDEQFAHSVAAGDFNGDGTSDVAIGSRAERVGSTEGAGSVHALYGSPTGFVTPRFFQSGEASLPLGSYYQTGYAVAG